MKIKTVLLAIPLMLFSLPLLAQDNAMPVSYTHLTLPTTERV